MKKSLFLLIIILLSWTQLIDAKGITVNTTVSSQTVHLGQSFQFIINVFGTTDSEIPTVVSKDFTFQYEGSCYGFSSIVEDSSLHIMYSVTPLTLGMISIPALKIKINDKNYETETVEIEVKERLDQSQFAQKIFVKNRINKPSIFIGEEIAYELKIYIAEQIEFKDIRIIDTLSSTFSAQIFEKKENITEEVNGIVYTVIPYTATIQPFFVGNIPMSPFFIEISVREQLLSSNDLLNSLVDANYKMQTIRLNTEKVVLAVMKTPEEKRPVDFQGAVGSFQMDVQLDVNEVVEGDPIKVRSIIQGIGNFRTVNPPTITNSLAFKTYEPKLIKEGFNVDTLKTEKIYEHTFAAIEVGNVPLELQFTYFDPQKEEYITLKKVLQLCVAEAEKSNNSKTHVYLPGDEKRITIRLVELVNGIKSTYYQLLKFGKKVVLNKVVLIILFLVLVVYLAVGCRKKYLMLIQERESSMKNIINKKLPEAKELINNGDYEEFSDLIHAIVQKYLKAEFNVIFSGISDHEEEVLKSNGLSDQTINMIRMFSRELDVIRFSKMLKTKNDMELLLEKAFDILKQIEKEKNEI